MNDGDHSGDHLTSFKQTITLIVIFLLLLVQLVLYLIPVTDNIGIPKIIWLGLLGIALFISQNYLRNYPWVNNIFQKIKLSPRVMAIGFSILLLLLATVGSVFFDNSNRAVYIPITSFWLLGATCLAGAFFLPVPMKQVIEFARDHRTELVTVGVITALAAALRFYKLGQLPFVINGDEGWIGTVAQSSNQGPLANPFSLWENFGASYMHGIRTSIRIFGANSFALRLLPAIGGVLAVPAVYLLARQITNKQIAAIAAFLLATSHAHINYSRTAAVAYIHGTWLVPLELFFLLLGLSKQNLFYSAVAGIILAIHFSIYLTAQVIIGMLVVFFLVLLIFNRAWVKSVWKQIAIFWVSFIMVGIPEFTYAFRHPNIFFSRMNLDGTFQSGWLAETSLATGKSILAILFDRVSHSFLTLIYYPSIDFYGTQSPLLTFFSAVLFMVGLVIALTRVRDRNFLLMCGYFWALTLSVGIFALPPSADSYRMLAVVPPAVIFAAIGLTEILNSLRISQKKNRYLYSLVVGVLLVSIFFTNYWIYYIDFLGSCKYGEDTQTRFSTHLGYFLGSVNRESTIYLLSDDIIFYGQNPSVDFLSGGVPVTNVKEGVDSIQPKPGSVIVAIPNRIDELKLWAQTQPGGDFTHRFDCRNTILSAYKIP